MALKKAAIAVPLMTPLIVITVLFNSYVRQEHFRCAEVLPLNECLEIDRTRRGQHLGKYVQEELREKQAFPELSEERAQSLGLVRPPAEDLEKHDEMAFFDAEDGDDGYLPVSETSKLLKRTVQEEEFSEVDA